VKLSEKGVLPYLVQLSPGFHQFLQIHSDF